MISHLRSLLESTTDAACQIVFSASDRSPQPLIHTVEQGEHLSTIAEKYGFRDYRTIWNDPKNVQLKAKRKNPNVLYPGDEVFIPTKQQGSVDAATGRVHQFTVKKFTLRLLVVVQDANGQPLPNLTCRLEVNGEMTDLTTDGEGKIDREIPVPTREGRLIVRNQQYHFRIGDLDPIDTESGWRARLANLGYYLGGGSEVDEEELRSAVEEFQCEHGLAVDGVCGRITQAKLLKIYGC